MGYPLVVIVILITDKRKRKEIYSEEAVPLDTSSVDYTLDLISGLNIILL
jgi:hypothetical protein